MIDAGSLYDAAISGQMHLVKEQAEKHLRANESSCVTIHRYGPQQLDRTCTYEDGNEVWKETPRQTISTIYLKVSVVSMLIHGYSTYVINITAQSPEEKYTFYPKL